MKATGLNLANLYQVNVDRKEIPCGLGRDRRHRLFDTPVVQSLSIHRKTLVSDCESEVVRSGDWATGMASKYVTRPIGSLAGRVAVVHIATARAYLVDAGYVAGSTHACCHGGLQRRLVSHSSKLVSALL